MQSAKRWETADRDLAELYRGARLSATLDWSVGRDHELNELEREFLAAGRAENERELTRQRRQNRRLKTLLAGVAVLLLAAVAAGAVALVSRATPRSPRPRRPLNGSARRRSSRRTSTAHCFSRGKASPWTTHRRPAATSSPRSCVARKRSGSSDRSRGGSSAFLLHLPGAGWSSGTTRERSLSSTRTRATPLRSTTRGPGSSPGMD